MTVPLLVQRILKSATWQMPPLPDPVLFLTFDDGPNPDVTPIVLDILKSFKAKATFFCVGENILQHRDVFEKTLADGHAIGNHSFYHMNGWKTKTSDYVEDVKRCDDVLKSEIVNCELRIANLEMEVGSSELDVESSKIEPGVLNRKFNGQKPNTLSANSRISTASLFRPPYGKLSPGQYSTLKTQYKIVMWGVLSGDFNKKNTGEKCLAHVCQNARNGSIVVFHDSAKAKERVLYCLPKVLDYFSQKNFSFPALSSDLL